MKNNRRRLIFIIVYFAYTAIYIARVNLSIAGPALMDASLLNTAQLGMLGSVFSTVYAMGRLFNGSISDQTPPWLMLTAGLTLAGISNLCVGFFPPFIGIFLLWAANAYAQSMLWSSVLCVVSAIYEPSVAKKKTSLMVTSVATGNVLGILVNTALITAFGVKFAFVVPGILTVVLGILVLLATKKIAPPAPVQNKKHISIFSLLRNKEMLTMCVPAMFHGVMKENISLWMAVFIVDTYLVDLSTSSYYILLIPLIGLAGRTAYSAAYKLCRDNEHNVSLAGFLVCAVASVLLCFRSVGIIPSVIALSLIYAAASMINTSILSIYPLHYISTGNVASVSGIMDFATYLGAGISSAVYGIVIKSFGYLPMFVSWIVISAISYALIVRIRKNTTE